MPYIEKIYIYNRGHEVVQPQSPVLLLDGRPRGRRYAGERGVDGVAADRQRAAQGDGGGARPPAIRPSRPLTLADVVLSDGPIGTAVQIRGFNHLLAESGV